MGGRGDDLFVGVHEGHTDPAVAIVQGGRVLAYSEEERHLRYKHARGVYPIRALRFCLDTVGAGIDDVTAVAVNWDLAAHADGSLERFFQDLGRAWRPDPATIAWQRNRLAHFHPDRVRARHEFAWRQAMGDRRFPPIRGVPHHYGHAFQACMQSPFAASVCITVDGSGDRACTVVWQHQGEAIRPLRQIDMPHSLGWYYAAFTEYLGFEAYDGEYKVMGLAAYGYPDPGLQEKVARVLHPAGDGVEYRVDPRFIHYGPHSYSGRFTDHLVELFGRPPRLPDEEISQWHEDLAFAVQHQLEECVLRLARWALAQGGTGHLCRRRGGGTQRQTEPAPLRTAGSGGCLRPSPLRRQRLGGRSGAGGLLRGIGGDIRTSHPGHLAS